MFYADSRRWQSKWVRHLGHGGLNYRAEGWRIGWNDGRNIDCIARQVTAGRTNEINRSFKWQHFSNDKRRNCWRHQYFVLINGPCRPWIVGHDPLCEIWSIFHLCFFFFIFFVNKFIFNFHPNVSSFDLRKWNFHSVEVLAETRNWSKKVKSNDNQLRD